MTTSEEDAMRSITRRLAVGALVGVFVLAWGAETDRDAMSAQAPAKIKATRIYTGTDGQSHAEDIELTAGMMMNATGVQFNRAPAGRFSDWHVGPRRQFVITLSGKGELELAGGRKLAVEPGDIELIEDTTGKGHTTRVVGAGDRITISIPLADQTVKVGPSR
jgi:quercetin dioxygenase-like cupin family protein